MHPLQKLYDRLPRLNCQGHCGVPRPILGTCCGPIGCSRVEAMLLDQYDGIASPWLTTETGGQMMDPRALFAATGKFECPHLTQNGRCGAYEVRPLICRMWGATHGLRCQWGCQPTRWLSATDTMELMREAQRLSDEYFNNLKPQ